jgi:hypothetical protein
MYIRYDEYTLNDSLDDYLILPTHLTNTVALVVHCSTKVDNQMCIVGWSLESIESILASPIALRRCAYVLDPIFVEGKLRASSALHA